MRKLINDPANFVDEVIDGILTAHPNSLRAASDDRRAIVRQDFPNGNVGIVTGGGSGHLPLFLGYVGSGLCSGVAIGNVFSSPSAEQILAATKAVDGVITRAAGRIHLGRYLIPRAFAGDPIPCGICSGALERRNSYTVSVSESSLRASRSQSSPIAKPSRPMRTRCK